MSGFFLSALFSEACALYNGFYLKEAHGNNAFSFQERKQRTLFVPPLIRGNLTDVQIGALPAFVEFDEGKEHVKVGLQNFVAFEWQGKPVFIFDNHNHAFFFWLLGFKAGIVPPGLPLLHVDQHTDLRQPSEPPAFRLTEPLHLKEVFTYTNQTLNVGNFIQPALKLNLFSEVWVVNTTPDFQKHWPEPFVLDIDLDIFVPELSHMNDDFKLEQIRSYMDRATLITIATSPFFIDQQLALEKLQQLFTRVEHVK